MPGHLALAELSGPAGAVVKVEWGRWARLSPAVPHHSAWQAGQAQIATEGGADRRSARGADAPINQSREAHQSAPPLHSPRGMERPLTGATRQGPSSRRARESCALGGREAPGVGPKQSACPCGREAPGVGPSKVHSRSDANPAAARASRFESRRSSIEGEAWRLQALVVPDCEPEPTESKAEPGLTPCST